jgi:hypothetical protein
LHGELQILVSADGVNLVGENINVEENTEVLLDASKEVGLFGKRIKS